MNKLLLAALFACCTSASATVLTFDDLNGNLSPINDGYGGFLWNVDTSVGVANGVRQAANNPDTPGFATGVVSSPNVAFNFAGGNPTSIARAAGDTFTFNSAFFTSSSGIQQLTFTGLASGNILFNSVAYTITQAGPLNIELNWSGIDTLQINTDMDGNPPWVMDDFSFTAAAGDNGTVPEPVSLSLMGLGLAALGASRRRKG